ncbi:MAG: hypothetical protein IKM97_01310 [Clostridia bacterium]|nr:hypothetical protein [Clostridia bacterium]
MLSGNNGLLKRARDARDDTIVGQEKEQVELAYVSATVKKLGNNVDETDLQIELNSSVGNDKTKVTTNADETLNVLFYDTEHNYNVNSGNVSKVEIIQHPLISVKDKNGLEIISTTETTPFLPDANNNEITNNDLSSGLTIKDSNQNEWVWIVVPKTAEVYVTAGLKISEFNDTAYDKIETDLRNYCTTDKSGNTLIAVGTSSSSNKSTTYGCVDSYVTGRGKNITSEAIYKEYKQRMLKSVYENGGFYIGKYETGTWTPRGSAYATLTTAVIQQNAYTYNYVTNAQAENLSEDLATGGKTTSLLFGLQWDLVLKHLSNLGVATSDLISDSSNWGNYNNKAFEIDRGEYSVASPWGTFKSYTTATANKVTISGGISKKAGTTSANAILLTTGASDNNSKFNIFDFAGNVNEWTLETSSSVDTPCVTRGSGWSSSGVLQPASIRFSGYAQNKSLASIGFRVSLY